MRCISLLTNFYGNKMLIPKLVNEINPAERCMSRVASKGNGSQHPANNKFVLQDEFGSEKTGYATTEQI